jgi:hypothetical protein
LIDANIIKEIKSIVEYVVNPFSSRIWIENELILLL